MIAVGGKGAVEFPGGAMVAMIVLLFFDTLGNRDTNNNRCRST